MIDGRGSRGSVVRLGSGRGGSWIFGFLREHVWEQVVDAPTE